MQITLARIMTALTFFLYLLSLGQLLMRNFLPVSGITSIAVKTARSCFSSDEETGSARRPDSV
jgi:hypothetical protein